jgi:hypothetical protein
MQNEKKKMALAKAASNAVKSNGSKQTTKSAPAAKTPAAQKAAVKNAQDLKVKALQAKAKAAKSKFQSSKMRDENTPMPLAKGEYSARIMRSALKSLGESGKGIMDVERQSNKEVKEWNDMWRPRTKQDSAAYGNKHPYETDPIKYKEVRKSKLGKKK